MIQKENSDNTSSAKGNMILVTGGSGLVGTELITQLLRQGRKIKATYNKTPLPAFNNKNITAFKCDILDIITLQQVMEDVTHVFHCAAIVSFSPKDRDEVLKINVEGTTNVVNAATTTGIKKLVHVSSVAALNKSISSKKTTEELIWKNEPGNNLYGRSKFLAEMEVWRAMGEGLPAVIVNPSLILGGTDWNKGSTAIFKTVYNEFPWYTEGVTGFVDVRDVAKAMILLMDSTIINERFILNAENISYKDVFTLIAESFSKKPPHKRVSPLLAELVWRTEVLKTFLTGKKHLLTKDTARTAQAKVYFDNTKIKTTLPGFTFIPLKQTINDTCATLLELNHL